tara:strand:+ start:687 stop:848 length:162 start_codon:yes stop_codon:yes gene_type:complete
MGKKKKSLAQIIDEMEDLHAQEDDLLEQIKEHHCCMDELDDELDADFDNEEDR